MDFPISICFPVGSSQKKNTKNNRRKHPLPTGTTSGSSPIRNEEFPSCRKQLWRTRTRTHESATVLKNLMANGFNDNEDQYNEDQKDLEKTQHNRKQTVNL